MISGFNAAAARVQINHGVEDSKFGRSARVRARVELVMGGQPAVWLTETEHGPVTDVKDM